MSEHPERVQGLVMCKGAHGERVAVNPAHIAAAYFSRAGDRIIVRVALAGVGHVDLHRSECHRFGLG